jgi:hypothetical protein
VSEAVIEFGRHWLLCKVEHRHHSFDTNVTFCEPIALALPRSGIWILWRNGFLRRGSLILGLLTALESLVWHSLIGIGFVVAGLRIFRF